MEEWKYRRETYYALGKLGDNSDSMENHGLEIVERFSKKDIIQDALNYSLSHSDLLYYPGKSYAVAIHYASWIQDFFGGELLSLLDDPELLNSDDPYFVRYSQDKETYDEILKTLDSIDKYIDKRNRTEMLPFLGMTYQYFLKEFMLDEEGKKILPFNGPSSSLEVGD